VTRARRESPQDRSVRPSGAHGGRNICAICALTEAEHPDAGAHSCYARDVARMFWRPPAPEPAPWRPSNGFLLRPKGVALPDDTIFRYGHPDRPAQARVVAEVVCEQGLGDEVGWAVILGDAGHWTDDGKGRPVWEHASVLANFRLVHGNRRNARRKSARRSGQDALW
jgi:hypothetical protein